jgi:hypothetical protein
MLGELTVCHIVNLSMHSFIRTYKVTRIFVTSILCGYVRIIFWILR